ncbi:MAG: bifunctional (p)ppGpp synthetase/guanosine-3',5'-bis(diphosphate) 3'-pyrophosphohydrolase [Candidatus Marinimicrobia bacterium]|nr:bifunctional (p)ppGpp synthetase/guanosine-3',5'-bis(diphosphate) 3'-pyrophosphohydrolase [Candidatus Neomarinimicrobiota bacterium]MBT3693072.1 bifunctional (p)ppGpp synthetase/guanosine-3',5'-bis(diphosphate) 3'-pyrophosphohydrolase [Candidatus Neomarinimicrobiota bacterium]MBT3732786.1 bifunctional (p)ppGpp synthetase/guanosine-3',5'-bis(diphosphate) 3'-pyrophosphohydrolase [Candidatus Neomarinimicrobiota bacterium]MBT4143936.1 bifunctional (p)ppGpp synthetase/guanosine-3',5'-bis(diphospha
MTPDSVKAELWKAYQFASISHEGQKRRSGEPYFIHCVHVAETLARWKMDLTTIMGGLLHDTVEDTDVSIEDLKIKFGDDLADLVDGVTKISGLELSSRREKQAENFMKMLLSVAKDLRVIIIKFADRLHNMETIQHMTKMKQRRIAVETRDVFVPLAHRLGMAQVKSQLEDLVLKTLHPGPFKEIESNLKATKKQREKFIHQMIKPINDELQSREISSNIYGRAKSHSSIFGKMVKREKLFEEIYDIYAIRIIVDSVEACYVSLGILHDAYTPIHDRFKDFIATPKSNGYQSLHTTVMDPAGQMVEIQIRTKEMDETAEIGIAAHWIYKEGGKKSKDLDSNVKWLRELLEMLQDEKSDSAEFMHLLKIDLFKNEIFVYTPKGDLVQLPSNATPVDFAYEVHTEVGFHCIGAKINHQVAPLNTKLKNGDVIEVITSKNQTPSYGWQKFAVTSKARNSISKYLRKTRMEESIKLGQEILVKTLRRLKRLKDQDEIKDSYESFGFKTTEELLSALGGGHITVREIFQKLHPQDELDISDEEKDDSNRFLNFARSKTEGIVLDGISDIMVNFGKCCNPIPGDKMVGFITRGRGITVHRSDCKSLPLLSHESDRLLPVEWNVKRKDLFNVRLKVVGEDKKGVLKDLSEAISKMNINITSVETKVYDNMAETYFVISINNNRQLDRLFKKLTAFHHVDYVERTT